MGNSFLNLAFYKFVPLENPNEWKKRIQDALGSFSIRGTLLLAPEGMNGFLAGPENELRAAFTVLAGFEPFHSLEAKESFSNFIPFEFFTIKVKKEIVTFRIDEVTPPKPLGKRISAKELAQWYDKKEDFIIVDTRNEYEVRFGTFENAKSFGLNHFVEFADAIKPKLEDWKNKKIVTFCTGGIRCEKAAPYIASLGHDEVYQLDGGILKYFEEVGGAHWNGECFVFDQRIGLLPNLEANGARLCEYCQGPIPKSTAQCIHCGK